MNNKPYFSGNKIKRIEKPIIGKPRKIIETQAEEVAINFSITKQKKVIGKISKIKALMRFSDKVNEPIYRLIMKHNTPKQKISLNQSIKSILIFVMG